MNDNSPWPQSGISEFVKHSNYPYSVVRADATILFPDNSVEAQIGHMALPGSGSEESSDRTSTRAKVLTISPIFLDTIYSNPTI